MVQEKRVRSYIPMDDRPRWCCVRCIIFSRRRPIDGWKYMIEELGPNSKKGKGSVSRLPSLSDASTQPFKEEKTPLDSRLTPLRGR
jgi:hypothetical protein